MTAEDAAARNQSIADAADRATNAKRLLAGLNAEMEQVQKAVKLSGGSKPWEVRDGQLLAAGMPVSWPSSTGIADLITRRDAIARDLQAALQDLRKFNIEL